MAFIKICGMTDARAVEAALAARVDAIGFVFAPSVRRVTAAQAALLAAPARGKALVVAVTQHPDAALLQEIFTQFQPDVLQTDVEDLPSIALPPGVKSWPVLRGAPTGLLPVSATPGQPLLFEGPRSGTGKVADWSAARLLASTQRLILAGGLSPANVAEAIALIESFVSRARAAFAQPGSGELT
jgi:phosphoribosylanthranilate isomerase